MTSSGALPGARRKKTGLEKKSNGREHKVHGLFSDLFYVAASRPAQITTG
jgi:hypothetical protein